MRINKYINLGIINWSNTKLSSEHLINCMAESKENYQWDLWSQRVNLSLFSNQRLPTSYGSCTSPIWWWQFPVTCCVTCPNSSNPHLEIPGCWKSLFIPPLKMACHLPQDLFFFCLLSALWHIDTLPTETVYNFVSFELSSFENSHHRCDVSVMWTLQPLRFTSINLSSQYYPWIKHDGYENRGNDHHREQ